jgi:hypothetical protein
LVSGTNPEASTGIDEMDTSLEICAPIYGEGVDLVFIPLPVDERALGAEGMSRVLDTHSDMLARRFSNHLWKQTR